MQKSLYFETIYKLFVVMIDRCSSQFKTGQRCHCLFPSFKSRLTKKIPSVDNLFVNKTLHPSNKT